ncbi:MAG: tRNA (adenosine(37)-N6)-threonylcarbamoyltransferase complex transferase subunit TsaD [Armatimonadota bacterium]
MSNAESSVLGIETSCDETAAAVVQGLVIRSSVVASQEEIHAMFGGVVPEVASRKHTETIVRVVQRALDEAEVTWEDIDALAVTNGPGLIGSLLVGVSAAKAYHITTGLPLYGINHLQAHVAANFAHDRENALHPDDLPAIILIASGGHSDIVYIETPTDYQVLGQTVDDAAGEAFDKAARVLDLGYPGGPAISQAAEDGDSAAYDFPRPTVSDTLDFSFSGLKTAMVRQVEEIGSPAADTPAEDPATVADLAASFQAAVVDTLVRNVMRATEESGVNHLAIAGGVAANRLLRKRLRETCNSTGIQFHVPPPELCTDNAAMVALAGTFQHGTREPENLSLGVFSAMPGK